MELANMSEAIQSLDHLLQSHLVITESRRRGVERVRASSSDPQSWPSSLIEGPTDPLGSSDPMARPFQRMMRERFGLNTDDEKVPIERIVQVIPLFSCI